MRRARAVGRVKGPAGIDAAGDRAPHGEDRAEDVDVPTRQIQLRKCEVFRADHHRHEEVAERGRDAGDQEKENHDHAVQREQFVVSIGLDEVGFGRGEFEPD